MHARTKILERNGFGIYELLYSQLETLVCVFQQTQYEGMFTPRPACTSSTSENRLIPSVLGHTNTLKTVFEACVCVCMWHLFLQRAPSTNLLSFSYTCKPLSRHTHADKSECYHTHVNTNTCKRLSWKNETMSLMVPFDTVPSCGLTLICVCPRSFADICKCNTDPPGLRNLEFGKEMAVGLTKGCL